MKPPVAPRRRDYLLLIPGVNDAARRKVSGYEHRSTADSVLAERRMLAMEPPGTEYIRAYIREFDRINALVHVMVDFPQPCDFRRSP